MGGLADRDQGFVPTATSTMFLADDPPGSGLTDLDRPTVLQFCGPIYDRTITARLASWNVSTGLSVKLGKHRGRGRMGTVYSLEIEGFHEDLVCKLSSWFHGGKEYVTRDGKYTYRELEVYQRYLQPLQGKVVPKCYGLWEAKMKPGELYEDTVFGLVLENAGLCLSDGTLEIADQ